MSYYEDLFRKLHPRRTTCPYGKSAELGDLWPCDQDEFKRLADFYRKHGDPIGREVYPGDPL